MERRESFGMRGRDDDSICSTVGPDEHRRHVNTLFAEPFEDGRQCGRTAVGEGGGSAPLVAKVVQLAFAVDASECSCVLSDDVVFAPALLWQCHARQGMWSERARRDQLTEPPV